MTLRGVSYIIYDDNKLLSSCKRRGINALGHGYYTIHLRRLRALRSFRDHLRFVSKFFISYILSLYHFYNILKLASQTSEALRHFWDHLRLVSIIRLYFSNIWRLRRLRALRHFRDHLRLIIIIIIIITVYISDPINKVTIIGFSPEIA